METHEQREKEKRELEGNLKRAIRNCKKLMVNNRLIENFQLNPILRFGELKEEDYEDGSHNYKISAEISIIWENGDVFTQNGKIIFFGTVRETKFTLENETVIAEYGIFAPSEMHPL